jgi:hypothetical protein
LEGEFCWAERRVGMSFPEARPWNGGVPNSPYNPLAMERRDGLCYFPHVTVTRDVSKHHLSTPSSMGSIRSRQLMRWAAGALVVLLVHSLGASRSVWAGCNHLVGSRSDSFLKFDQFDKLIQGDSIAPSSDDLAGGSQGPNRNRPCSGMSCSGRVPLPVSTASQGPEGSDQWGALTTVVVVVSPSASGRPSDELGQRASGQAAFIFHPPRV